MSLYSHVISPTIEDEENAELRFLRNIQQSHFSEEYNLLKIIRVGGRLKKANIPYDAKHQILIVEPDLFKKVNSRGDLVSYKKI